MEIHQLEYFLAVEKYGSFSSASLEVNVSQSTMSQQIKKLEDELGVLLFIRYSRSVELTPAGQDFLVHAQRIVNEIADSRETIEQYTTFDKGLIKIGSVPYMAYLGLNQIITNFLTSHPTFDFEVHAAHSDDLLKWMRERKINVAFISSPFTGDYDIDFYPLVNDRIVALVYTDHPAAKKSQIDLSDLSVDRLLLLKSSTSYRNNLIKACKEAGFEPKMGLEDGNVEMIRSFVEAGLGVSLMGSYIANSISTSKTKVIPIKQDIQLQSGLAIPKYSRLPIATSCFKDFTLKEAKILLPN